MAKTAEKVNRPYEVKKDTPRRSLKFYHYKKDNGAWGIRKEWIDTEKITI